MVEDRDYGLLGNPKACHMFKNSLLEWDEKKVKDVFHEVDAKAIWIQLSLNMLLLIELLGRILRNYIL